MTDETTDRLGLPLLASGQAQKEVSHNEALALLDLAVQPAVTAVALDIPPTAPAPGACWIVGTAPTAAWTGRAGALAGWTASGWRFIAAREGMAVWSIGDAATARFSGGAWTVGQVRGTSVSVGGVQVVGARQPAVAAPAGGSTVDAEARASLAAALAALRAHGLIAP